MPATPRRPSSPLRASFLSFIWPGLGQWYQGRPRAAAMFAVPALGLGAILVLELAGGLVAFGLQFLDPAFALTVLALIVFSLMWRLAALVEALREPGASIRRPGRGTTLGVATMAAVLVGSHALAGYYAWSFYDADSQIFVAGPDATSTPGLVAAGGSAVPSPSVQPTPYVTPRTASSRVTILVTGVDSAPGRNHALTDTLLVVSVDPVSKQVAMLSVARDTSDFPLYMGGTFPGKINSLMEAAQADPRHYPEGPVNTLNKEIGFLLGVPVDYFASIDLEGFISMVDLVGGVDVINPKPIDDPAYDWLNGHLAPFQLAAGPQHLVGPVALAYVRSRQGPGDNDFTRAARQQQVLVALKAKLTSAAMLPRLPAILKIAARTVRTDFPSGQIAHFVSLAEQIPNSDITRIVLGPPYAVSLPGGTYSLRMDMAKIKALSIRLFGSDSAYYQAAASPSDSSGGSAAP